MKVTGPKVGATNRAGPKAPPAPVAAFSMQAAVAPKESGPAARTSGVTGVSSLDALLALQQLDGPTERRKRAVGRATKILDVLDEVKVALLGGDLGPQSLSKLMNAVREERSATEDPGLEGVLDEIETRAAVELAKWEARAAA